MILVDFLKLNKYSSLKYLQIWISPEMLFLTASNILVPSCLLMLHLNFSICLEKLFDIQYQTIWDKIDQIFSKHSNLLYFVIWTISEQKSDCQKKEILVLERGLPRLLKKDILWWGDWNTKSGLSLNNSLFLKSY